MLFGAMPRLSSAIVGIWVMNGRQSSENVKMMTRHWPTTAVVAGDLEPSSSRCRPWVPAGRRRGSGDPRRHDDDDG